MRYNQGIQRLQRDSRYHDAKDVLWNILNQTLPSDDKLHNVFGPSRSPYIKQIISEFLSSLSLSRLKARTHYDAAPTEISARRLELETNPFYLKSQMQLLEWHTPDADTLSHLYGEYASTVGKFFSMFLQLGLRRKCGISTAAHLNRVGALTGAMGIDEGSSRMYSAIGALHDSIEDLLNRIPDKKGKTYGLRRYDEFVQTYLPQELQSSVVLLTNHYDLILDHVSRGLALKERAVTKNTVLAFLEQMRERKFPDLHPYILRLHALLSRLDTDHDFFETAKWYLYKELYIHDMAQVTERMSNYRTYEIKAIDLTDNAHGRDALAMSGRIKNLIKMDIWARKGFSLKSSWRPLNDHIMEIEEDALVHAEHLIIRDFLESSLTLDFVASALLKIKDLSTVFFIDDESVTQSP